MSHILSLECTLHWVYAQQLTADTGSVPLGNVEAKLECCGTSNELGVYCIRHSSVLSYFVHSVSIVRLPVHSTQFARPSIHPFILLVTFRRLN